MVKVRHLLDVNVLLALLEKDHVHHALVMRWFNTMSLDWGVCPFTEAGFLRISSNSTVGMLTVPQATVLLNAMALHPGYRFWCMNEGWSKLAAPFMQRVAGSQQITDAYLLGLAVREDGVLVTLDKGILHLAGAKFRRHVLVLE